MAFKDDQKAKEYQRLYRQTHKENIKAANDRYYAKHKTEIAEKHKGEEYSESQKVSYHRHREDRLDRRHRYEREIRKSVIMAYGGKCACCGESQIEFLAIDHVNGNGNQHRKITGGGGHKTYIWLRRNNFPEGFQVLCHNCNMAKSFYGQCPHQRG